MPQHLMSIDVALFLIKHSENYLTLTLECALRLRKYPFGTSSSVTKYMDHNYEPYHESILPYIVDLNNFLAMKVRTLHLSKRN